MRNVGYVFHPRRLNSKPVTILSPVLVIGLRRALVIAVTVFGLTMSYCGLAQAKVDFEVLAYLDQNIQNAEERLAEVRVRAEKGNLEAQHELGALLATGRGSDQDYVEAAYWLEQAAPRGHDDAQFWLGNLYMRGAGLPQDFDRMAMWWLKAAKQGNISAQYALATAYRDGSTVEQDMALSRTWFMTASGKSVDDNVHDSRQLANKVMRARKMTPAEAATIAKAEAKARRFARDFGEEGQGGR